MNSESSGADSWLQHNKCIALPLEPQGIVFSKRIVYSWRWPLKLTFTAYQVNSHAATY